MHKANRMNMFHVEQLESVSVPSLFFPPSSGFYEFDAIVSRFRTCLKLIQCVLKSSTFRKRKTFELKSYKTFFK